jgi:hypothetical protein
MEKRPKLRTVEKYEPLYLLNKFPSSFAINLGKEIIYFLATRDTPRLEGSDWEEIFSRVIGAQWKPSNVGLDDVVYEQMAWGAKTVKNNNPLSATKVRLISGRNSPVYSYGDKVVSECEPNELGEKIISIWNERVAGIRKLFKHLRTVVLIKSADLLVLSVFEFETIMYTSSDYSWRWNAKNNLEGFNKSEKQHIFTWQPHGSQFTIIEEVPKDRLSIRIKRIPRLNKEAVLKSINFKDSWIQIIS